LLLLEKLKKLQDDLKYAEGFLASVLKKLSNEKFVNGAPAAVIEKERNKQRDIEKRIQLRHLGWHTIIIWGCELLPKNRLTTLQALEQTLNKIFLLNNGAKVTTHYSNEDKSTGMVAEGE
jgi:hypothetical protein